MSRLLVTEAAVRAAVVDVARSRVGRHYGVGAVTPYGTWYGPGWERAYFCAAGWSWCWNQALGETDARSVIGYQTHGGVAPRQRGFIWTVAIMTQHRARTVPLAQLQPGDAVMYRYNSGDNRQGNEVNHVDIVEVNRPDLGYVDCIGFNVPQPGAPAGTDPSRGGGNWRRRTWYNNPFVVAGLKMPADGLAERNRAAWSGVQRHYNTLELGKFEMTGVPGPATRAATATYAAEYGYTGDQADPLALLTHLENTMDKLDQILARLENLTVQLPRAERRAIAQEVLGYKNIDAAGNTDVFGFLVGSYRQAAAAATREVDTAALADALRDDLTTAIRDAGGGASADDVVDRFVERLSTTPQED